MKDANDLMQNEFKFKPGDRVAVLPHVEYQHLVGNTIVRPPRRRWHPGYEEARFVGLLFEDIVEVEVGDGVDYVALSDLKPLA